MPKPPSDQIVGFDYSRLKPKVAAIAKKASLRIKRALNGAATEVGRELLLVKGKLSHGEFGAWLLAEFDLSARTAQRYMTTARLAAKSDTLSQMPAVTLYALGAPSTPTVVQDDIIRRAEAGEKITRADVAKAIADLKPAKGEKPGKRFTPEHKAAEQATDSPHRKKVRDASKVAGAKAISLPSQYFRMKTAVGQKVVNRQAPADTKYFWVRVKRRDDHLLVCSIAKAPPR